MSEFLDDIKSFFGTGAALVTEGPKPVPEQWKDDPVAQKTDWGPNEKGGVNLIRTHKVVESGADRLEVRRRAVLDTFFSSRIVDYSIGHCGIVWDSSRGECY